MKAEGTVFVVDDDEAVRESMQRLMASVGLPVETFPHAQAFLEGYRPQHAGCLVLDVRMPGMSGLELQQQLVRNGMHIPVIIISAHGDVESAVQAMKSGAVDFVRKPYKGSVLLERVRQALSLDAQQRRHAAEQSQARERLDRLTSRENEVLNLLILGKSAKQIAFELGLSRKTVDIHRSHIMMKVQVESIVDLVRVCQSATLPNGKPASS